MSYVPQTYSENIFLMGSLKLSGIIDIRKFSYGIIGAMRPDAIILQHAPKRRFYDGFPEYPIEPLEKDFGNFVGVGGGHYAPKLSSYFFENQITPIRGNAYYKGCGTHCFCLLHSTEYPDAILPSLIYSTISSYFNGFSIISAP